MSKWRVINGVTIHSVIAESLPFALDNYQISFLEDKIMIMYSIWLKVNKTESTCCCHCNTVAHMLRLKSFRCVYRINYTTVGGGYQFLSLLVYFTIISLMVTFEKIAFFSCIPWDYSTLHQNNQYISLGETALNTYGKYVEDLNAHVTVLHIMAA